MALTEYDFSFQIQEWRETVNVPGIIVSEAPIAGRPGIMFLHGNSRIGHREFKDSQYAFAERGFAAYAFSLPGSIPSGKKMSEVTHNDRIRTAKRAYNYFIEKSGTDKTRVALLGAGEGGDISIRITNDSSIQPRVLILDNPVAVPEELLNLNFGVNFDIMEGVYSWRNSKVFDLVRIYRGPIYLTLDDNDPYARPMRTMFQAALLDHGGVTFAESNNKIRIATAANYLSKSI